jgi:hypothetical protein
MTIEILFYPAMLVAAIVAVLNWFTKGELD